MELASEEEMSRLLDVNGSWTFLEVVNAIDFLADAPFYLTGDTS